MLSLKRPFFSVSTFGVLVLLGAARADQPTSPLGAGPIITNPGWARKPSADNFLEAFPVYARSFGIEGSAEMSCQVTARGGLTGCAVLRAAPEGLGFGASLLKLARFFDLKPSTIDGARVGGARVNIPATFLRASYGGQRVPRDQESPTTLLLARRLVAAEGLDAAVNDAAKAAKAKYAARQRSPNHGKTSEDSEEADFKSKTERVDRIAASIVEALARSAAVGQRDTDIEEAITAADNPKSLLHDRLPSVRRRLFAETESLLENDAFGGARRIGD